MGRLRRRCAADPWDGTSSCPHGPGHPACPPLAASSGRAPGRCRSRRRAHRRDPRRGRAPGRSARRSSRSTAPAASCVPAFADVHAHLDSTRLGLPFRPHTAEPGLARADRERPPQLAPRRARRRGSGDAHAWPRPIAAGAVHVRSHAQVDADARLERLEGVLAARAAHADRCRVQVVAFPQSGIVRDPPTADLLDAAIAAGADLIGGIDPCGFDRDPVSHLDVVFGIAERRQVGVDIHLHETGALGAFTLELIAERTAALGMQGNVTVSHAFALVVRRRRATGRVDRPSRDERHRGDDRRARQPRTAPARGAACRRRARRSRPGRHPRLLVAVRQRRHARPRVAAGVPRRAARRRRRSKDASTLRRAADDRCSTVRPGPPQTSSPTTRPASRSGPSPTSSSSRPTP